MEVDEIARQIELKKLLGMASLAFVLRFVQKSKFQF